MATPLDYLSAPEFSDRRLTEAINVAPFTTGRPAQLGIFRDTPINTTFVRLSLGADGDLALIPARERGGPHNKNMRAERSTTIFSVPHFPLDDAITPSDIQNIGVWGDNFVMQTLGGVYNEKLQLMREKHDLTHSHLDWGALSGLVLDGENKVLLDTYDTFGITQDVVDFALGTTSTDIAARNRVVRSMMRTNLRGAALNGVRVFAGPDWFDAYVGHANIRAALAPYAAAGQINPAREAVDDAFNYAGLSVERIDEEYPVRLPDNTFVMRKAVPDDEAIAVPMGTPYFRRYLAPPDTIFDANQVPPVGQRIYVSTADLPHGKGRDIHTESNLVPVCVRPQAIIRLTMS